MLRECNNCIGAKMLGDAITIRKQKCLDMQDYLKSKKMLAEHNGNKRAKILKGCDDCKRV